MSKNNIDNKKIPIVHFRNDRTGKTLCGHSYKLHRKGYSKVTLKLDNVTCKGCLGSIMKSKWIKKMIDKENLDEIKITAEIVSDYKRRK